jgi:MFS transporter, ACS family, hexuronate transporter
LQHVLATATASMATVLDGSATMTIAQRRWTILALLVLAVAINEIDRQTLSVLGPTLRHQLSLSERDYANVVTAFLIPYTIMYLLSGRMVDFVGPRLVLALSFAWWSIASMLTGLARGAFSLGLFRCLLGMGEPCVFPAGVKTCAEWFRPQERALATGILNSGAGLGIVFAPPVVALCAIHFGWRYAFVLPGLLGVIWLPFWIKTYRDAERPAQAARKGASWRSLLKQRNVWALVLPRFASDPVWFFYLFWLPDYLQRARHLSLHEIAAYGWVPFVFADLGNISGGALSDWMVRRGLAPARARVRVMVGIACMAPLGALVGIVHSVITAIMVTSLVVFLTQAWTTNIATLASELLPASETGTAVGMMGTAGSLGGVLFAQILGILIVRSGYPAAFLVAACLYPIAIALLTSLVRFNPRGSLTPDMAGAGNMQN